MNKNQLNLITQLMSTLSIVRDKAIEDLTKEFDAVSDKEELKVVFEKFDNKLN